MASTSHPTSHPTPYEWLESEQYVSLVTFKKSGQRVATPIWFASAGGKLYMYSAKNVGKIKRIRANATVELAPCTARGKVTGPTVTGRASILADGQGSYVHDLLNRKYGWRKKVFEFAAGVPEKLKLRAPSLEDFIEVELE